MRDFRSVRFAVLLPIKQSLKAILDQYALKRLATRVGDIGKPLAHRRREILDLGFRHARLSR